MSDEGEIDRRLYLARAVSLERAESALADDRLPVGSEQGMAVLVVGDAAEASEPVLTSLAVRCRHRGVHWLSAWGGGSARLADAFARAACHLDVEPGWGQAVPADEPALALWHDSPLTDALELFWDAALLDLDRPAERGRPGDDDWGRPVRIVLVCGPDRAVWEDEVREAVHTVLVD